MREAWRRGWGGMRQPHCAFPQPNVKHRRSFPQHNCRSEREFHEVLHSQSPDSTAACGRAVENGYPAVSVVASASQSTWHAARQSASEADSAGVWLAPVGFRTNSIAEGTCGARMPAS